MTKIKIIVHDDGFWYIRKGHPAYKDWDYKEINVSEHKLNYWDEIEELWGTIQEELEELYDD